MNYVSPLTDGNKASAALACTISEIQSTKPAAKFCQLCVNSTANLRESEYISMQGTEGGRDFIPLRFAAAAPLLGAVVETIRDGVARQGPRTGTHSLRGKGPTGDQQGLQFASMVDRGGGPLGSHTTRTRSRTLPTTTWGIIQKHVHVGSVFRPFPAGHRRIYKARRGRAPRAVETPLSPVSCLRPPA